MPAILSNYSMKKNDEKLINYVMNQFFPSTAYGNSHKDTQKIYIMSWE
jgi:hypothetical protein